MKALKFFIIFALFVISATAEPIDSQSRDCYDEELKLTIKDGDTVDPVGKCLRMSCSNGFLHGEPCRTSIPPGCNLVHGDKTKGYPSCCPTVKC